MLNKNTQTKLLPRKCSIFQISQPQHHLIFQHKIYFKFQHPKNKKKRIVRFKSTKFQSPAIVSIGNRIEIRTKHLNTYSFRRRKKRKQIPSLTPYLEKKQSDSSNRFLSISESAPEQNTVKNRKQKIQETKKKTRTTTSQLRKPESKFQTPNQKN